MVARTVSPTEEFRRAAHTLKSSSRDIGVDELTRICSVLEAAARDGRIDATPETLASVEEHYERGADALRFRLEAGK